MKKFLALFLIVATALTALAGCSGEGESSDLNIYSEASYDNESKFVPDEESKESTTSESVVSGEENVPLSGEFVVKDKKYTFEGNDLVIVSVENKTNKNYSVTVTGTYLDKGGNVLKTETQTFDQYSAGYNGYFMFKPDLQFDKFTYEFKTKESEGPFYAKDMTFKFNGLNERDYYVQEQVEKGDYTMYPVIMSSVSFEYKGDTPIEVYTKWLLLNEKDEIIAVFSKSVLVEPNETFEAYFNNVLYYTLEGDLVWPEGWDGKLQAIPIFEDIVLNPTVYH